MQKVSNLRRNTTFKEVLKACLLLIGFYLYTCLSDIYLFLPPMIGLLFVFYVQVSKENLWILTFSIVGCLIFFELDYDKQSGILPLIFVIINWLVIKKLRLLFEDNVLFVFVYVGLIYFVYFFTLYLLDMFAVDFSWGLVGMLLSYVFYESCLGIVYEKIKYQI